MLIGAWGVFSLLPDAFVRLNVHHFTPVKSAAPFVIFHLREGYRHFTPWT